MSRLMTNILLNKHLSPIKKHMTDGKE